MDRNELTRIQGWSILGGAALMLSLAMGMRQSLGLFQPQMIRDIGVTAAQFSFAIAIQNIVWGVTQPFVGMAADRGGARPIAVGGVLLYAGGIALAIVAQSSWVLTLGIGIAIGIALSCTASNIAPWFGSESAGRSLPVSVNSSASSSALALAAASCSALMRSRSRRRMRSSRAFNSSGV